METLSILGAAPCLSPRGGDSFPQVCQREGTGETGYMSYLKRPSMHYMYELGERP